MRPPILVVSDPPHPDVDLHAAAALVGLDVFQTRLKFLFPAPEVLASSDGAFATGIAESYRRAGVQAATVDGQDLLDLPWPDLVSAFEFKGNGLIASTRSGDIELPYDTNIFGVYCCPPSDHRPEAPPEPADLSGVGLEIAEAIERTAILDLYFDRDGRTQRITLARGVTDFAGLDAVRQGTPAEDMNETVAGITRRFTRMVLDPRLENVRPRSRFRGGDAAKNPDTRQRYSFGTLLLLGILTSIGPEVGDLTQYELGSRLGYLTSRARARLPTG